MADVARLTVVPNELAAELVCSFLRAEGIGAPTASPNIGAGAWDGVPSAAGPREVLVDPADVDAAREVLASAEHRRVLDPDAPALKLRPATDWVARSRCGAFVYEVGFS